MGHQGGPLGIERPRALPLEAHFSDMPGAVTARPLLGDGSSDEGICRTLDPDWREPEFGVCSRREIPHFAGGSDSNFLCATQEFSS